MGDSRKLIRIGLNNIFGTLASVPLHSLVLSLYPILFLYSRNVVFIPFEESLRFQGVSFLIALILFIGFGLILRDWHKAAMLCSLLLVMFFSFGQLANMIDQSFDAAPVKNNQGLMAGIWLGLTLILLFLITRVDVNSRITSYLNVTSLVLIAFPLLTILTHTFIIARGSQDHVPELASSLDYEDAVTNDTSMHEQLPDIYYIVFDGYLREDILRDLYEYDNSTFLDSLESRGFFVADASRSNYLSTTYSLNTSLNLVYFHDFPRRIIPTARYNLKTNFVSDFLRRNGYKVVVFDSGTGDTSNQYADIFMRPSREQSRRGGGGGGFNRFEQLMLKTTLGPFLFVSGGDEAAGSGSDEFAATMDGQLQMSRERIEYAFEHLSDFAASDELHFLFAHFYLPHIPFLYGPHGEALDYREDLHLYWYQLQHEDYAEYYGYQLDYLNSSVLDAIDEIQAKSRDPYVIVLQSDHGDDLHLDWNDPTRQGVDVRSAILYSIQYSNEDTASYYDSVSPVNSFRIVFNDWFGTDFPLLPDEVYYHEHPLMTPFYRIPNFRNACPDFGICPNR